MEHARAGRCPSKPIFASAADSNRRTVKLASEFGELSIPTIKQGTGLAVGGVIMIDKRGQFGELILKPRMVRGLRGARPLSTRIS